MRLTLKDHRDAMVAMLANGNCPTSAARLAHAMHDVLSYLQSEPEAPVSHSERRDEATTPGLNDKLLALDVGALAKPRTVNQRVRKLEAIVKARDNTVNQLKENIRLLRDERAELTRQLEEALSLVQCHQEFMAASALPDENFTNDLFSPEGKEWIKGLRAETLQSGVRKEDTELPWIEWEGGECPVRDGAIVDLALFNETRWPRTVARNWDWTDTENTDRIVAYRVVKP